MKKLLILMAALMGCAEQEDQQPANEPMAAVSDTVQVDKIFCSNCGKLCKLSAKATGTYKSNTGEPLYFVKTKCPNAAWYNSCTDDYEQFSYIGPNRTTLANLRLRGIDVDLE